MGEVKVTNLETIADRIIKTNTCINIFSLKSPTLNEFFIYKLLQALSQESYENKCITVPSIGKTERISAESVDLIMNHSHEIIIDDCIDTLDDAKNESHMFSPTNIETFTVLLIHQ